MKTLIQIMFFTSIPIFSTPLFAGTCPPHQNLQACLLYEQGVLHTCLENAKQRSYSESRAMHDNKNLLPGDMQQEISRIEREYDEAVGQCQAPHDHETAECHRTCQ